MQKYFSLRFDIDTHRCMEKGILPLIELGRELDVRFTFFVTMGRAISRRHLVQNFFGKKPEQLAVLKLSNLKKLGLVDFIRVVLANPLVGSSPSSIRMLSLLQREGHEIGLHGGTNHGIWQHGVNGWSSKILRKEIEAGKVLMQKAGLRPPLGFSSPGWKSVNGLSEILSSTGFFYSADNHGINADLISRPTPSLKNFFDMPTNILGEPGGVGYIEWQIARGKNPTEIIEEFKAVLSKKHYAVAYDHPYFAGVRAIPILRIMLDEAKKQSFTILPMGEVLKRSC